MSAATGVAVSFLAGCADQPVQRTVRTPAPVTVTVTPPPARTVVHAFHRYDAGHTADFHAQKGVALRLLVGRPHVSTTRLSPAYGQPPVHGYYLTFHLAVTNTGSRPVDLSPGDFVVRMPRQGRVSSYDGNSPYSGASRQLDTTEIEPGDRVSAPLTFDVRRRHGRVDFRPDASTAIAWTF